MMPPPRSAFAGMMDIADTFDYCRFSHAMPPPNIV